jgi:hypothetical protein
MQRRNLLFVLTHVDYMQAETAKPVSMMDEMRNRMQRRNNALSGNHEREDRRKSMRILADNTKVSIEEKCTVVI